MRPSFQPRLVNPPYGDPSLYIPFAYRGEAILFDTGDLAPLSSREILKVDHIFITHTHMDHFIGFDRVLRLCLGRNKTLHLATFVEAGIEVKPPPPATENVVVRGEGLRSPEPL